MSGPGLTGAQAVVDIKTKKLKHDSITNKAQKESDVEIKMAVDPASQIKVGLRVKATQAAGLTLTITKPPGIVLTKEPLIPMAPLAAELEAAFPSPAGERWVAFSGQTPGGPPQPKLSLETALELDSNTIPAHAFQLIPVVMTRLLIPYNGGHYLVGSSLVPGASGRAMAVALSPGPTAAAKPAKPKPYPKPKPKTKPKPKPKKR